ncbi:MAG TPA: phosphoethanolamine--lipid A transferase [Methylophilus sp.]|nr:phosphoethanolamine--lipid A transferase [Methylophilus sp.]HQQ33008.1 phosphoethanolamine--lipid A transferase [Methylophilus sp.]
MRFPKVIDDSIRNLITRLQAFSTPQIGVIAAVTILIMLTGNRTLFNNLFRLYPSAHDIPFMISLTAFFSLSTLLLLMLICHGKMTRWILATYLILVAISAYFMDHFGIIIDTVMLDNVANTDSREAFGLFSSELLLRVILLGVLPAWWLVRYAPGNWFVAENLRQRFKHVGIVIALLALSIIPFSKEYFIFVREHKLARMYANPTFFTYSTIKYLIQKITVQRAEHLAPVAEDAKIIETSDKHELIILVVGETARWDRFSLNGYHRETNPELSKLNVLSLSNVSSCGTSTLISVPCMFSPLDREDYDADKAANMENVLDVLARNGVQILWRDNNSDSKGVALRVPYQDFKSPVHNPVCEDECRDIGMLHGLDQYIAARKGQDILIILHQMGNHGPEYYRRYPKQFERFRPACQTGKLSECSQQEVDNAYDNAILYTDYFLTQTIDFLKKYDKSHEVAMLYVSDHGESLGEHGIYLHAAPYFMAPKEQTHIPAIVWVGDHFDYKLDQLKPYQQHPFSHDDLFCGLLNVYDIGTKVCSGKLDFGIRAPVPVQKQS